MSIFKEADIGNIDAYTDRAHRVGETYFGQISSKKTGRVLLLNLQHSGIVQ